MPVQLQFVYSDLIQGFQLSILLSSFVNLHWYQNQAPGFLVWCDQMRFSEAEFASKPVIYKFESDWEYFPKASKNYFLYFLKL